jgi:hypothetical protein
MVLSEYDAYKKIFPYLLGFMSIFEFFFMKKVHRELNLEVNPYLLSGLTVLAMLIFIGGLMLIAGKLHKTKLQENKLDTVSKWFFRIILPNISLVIGLVIFYLRFHIVR